MFRGVLINMDNCIHGGDWRVTKGGGDYRERHCALLTRAALPGVYATDATCHGCNGTDNGGYATWLVSFSLLGRIIQWRTGECASCAYSESLEATVERLAKRDPVMAENALVFAVTDGMPREMATALAEKYLSGIKA